MDFATLVAIVGDEPVFETGLLLAGDVDPDHIRRQLSRWVKAGRVDQFRRGLYALATPFRKVRPHPFLVANRMVPASYVSLQSALAFYGLIPEVVPVTNSVTTARHGRWETPLGAYAFRHLQASLFTGYRLTDLGQGQQAFVATPEKGLLDLIYLAPEGDTPAYLQELRLQNLERLDPEVVLHHAERSGRPKLQRAARRVLALRQSEEQEYETL
jgi:predicted transcriptional regulator of viral defense system